MARPTPSLSSFQNVTVSKAVCSPLALNHVSIAKHGGNILIWDKQLRSTDYWTSIKGRENEPANGHDFQGLVTCHIREKVLSPVILLTQLIARSHLYNMSPLRTLSVDEGAASSVDTIVGSTGPSDGLPGLEFAVPIVFSICLTCLVGVLCM